MEKFIPQQNANLLEEKTVKFNKLYEFLKNELDTKAILTTNRYHANYDLTTADFDNPRTIIDGTSGMESEQSELLKELFNGYKEKQEVGFGNKYHDPHTEKNNAVSTKTYEEASFIIKNFLEDIKKTIS